MKQYKSCTFEQLW